jgi:hypothetical protein
MVINIISYGGNTQSENAVNLDFWTLQRWDQDVPEVGSSVKEE